MDKGIKGRAAPQRKKVAHMGMGPGNLQAIDIRGFRTKEKP
jgi:hypothetical protein